MTNFLPEEKALGCFRHKGPVVMQQSDGTEKDGTPMRHVFCPKCFCTLPLTAALRSKLDAAVAAETGQKIGQPVTG